MVNDSDLDQVNADRKVDAVSLYRPSLGRSGMGCILYPCYVLVESSASPLEIVYL